MWRGVHVILHGDPQAEALVEELPQLESRGINVLVLEVDYSFQFASHPELCSQPALSRAAADALAKACRTHGIRPIPLFNCLGHQSWSKTTLPLLAKYPHTLFCVIGITNLYRRIPASRPTTYRSAISSNRDFACGRRAGGTRKPLARWPNRRSVMRISGCWVSCAPPGVPCRFLRWPNGRRCCRSSNRGRSEASKDRARSCSA